MKVANLANLVNVANMLQMFRMCCKHCETHPKLGFRDPTTCKHKKFDCHI